jgi:riboflavin kinase / FMN adenylyltransferase
VEPGGGGGVNVLKGDPTQWPSGGTSAVTIGVYDGVHLGHQAVLEDLRSAAQRLGVDQTIVLTFDRHPSSVVNPDAAPKMLTSIARRIEILGENGVDTVGVLAFEHIRQMRPEEFIGRVLVDALRAKLVVVGSNFRFGVDRSGDVDTLRAEGERFGFEVDAVDLLRGDGATVSSTAIRFALEQGEVRSAAAALGRPYELEGTVVTGDGRGKTLGYPTANLAIQDGLLIPADGVYAVTAVVDDRTYNAVANIGVRPTFGGTDRVVEAFILDGVPYLYGRQIRLCFVERIRDERRFVGPEELVEQIGRDVETARSIFRS